MELSGALSNPRVQVDLPQLGALQRELGARETPRTAHKARVGRRQGEIKDTIMRVLKAADEPMRARDIHTAVENLAGTAVSWSTVKNCLARNASGPGAALERIAHGYYTTRR